MEQVSGPASDGATYHIHLSTDNIAMFVLMETSIDGIFSDNGFVMTERTTVLEFMARQSTSASELLGSINIRSLVDTYDA